MGRTLAPNKNGKQAKSKSSGKRPATPTASTSAIEKQSSKESSPKIPEEAAALFESGPNDEMEEDTTPLPNDGNMDEYIPPDESAQEECGNDLAALMALGTTQCVQVEGCPERANGKDVEKKIKKRRTVGGKFTETDFMVLKRLFPLAKIRVTCNTVHIQRVKQTPSKQNLWITAVKEARKYFTDRGETVEPLVNCGTKLHQKAVEYHMALKAAKEEEKQSQQEDGSDEKV